MELTDNELTTVLKWIEGLCSRFTKYGSPEWEDLVSVCVLRMVERLPNYDPNRWMSLKSWAIPIVCGALIDLLYNP